MQGFPHLLPAHLLNPYPFCFCKLPLSPSVSEAAPFHFPAIPSLLGVTAVPPLPRSLPLRPSLICALIEGPSIDFGCGFIKRQPHLSTCLFPELLGRWQSLHPLRAESSQSPELTPFSRVSIKVIAGGPAQLSPPH